MFDNYTFSNEAMTKLLKFIKESLDYKGDTGRKWNELDCWADELRRRVEASNTKSKNED